MDNSKDTSTLSLAHVLRHHHAELEHYMSALTVLLNSTRVKDESTSLNDLARVLDRFIMAPLAEEIAWYGDVIERLITAHDPEAVRAERDTMFHEAQLTGPPN